MATQNLPNLHSLSINTLYQDVLLDAFEREEKRYKKRIAKEPELSTKRNKTPNLRHWYDYLIKNTAFLEIAHGFVSDDFGNVPLCAAENLKKCLQVCFEQSVRVSKLSLAPRHDFFPPPEHDDLDDSQSKLIYQAYENYVGKQDAQANAVVELWTRENTESARDRGFQTAPHQIFDHYMLLNVGLNSHASPIDFDLTDELAQGGNPTWAKIRQLYRLVINAPRAPMPLLLFRTVRQTHRMPTAWFRARVDKEMGPGDSIITPTFLSTSLHPISHNWDMYGADAEEAAYDAYPVEKDCCIMQILVSKGVPMLPLGDFASNEHAYEHEVLLPPGIELVFLGDGVTEIEDWTYINTFSFIARVVPPPTED